MNYSQIFEVLELNLILKNIVNNHFREEIKVIGEISNFKHYSNSGHSYFSLKDKCAQISCTFFKKYQLQNNFSNPNLKNGTSAIIRAQVAVYEKTGQVQLIVHNIEPVGEGLLQRKFEEIRNKLEKEGLFDRERKKMLPKVPLNIGIISSLQGDALQDIISVLQRRYPIANVYIYPSSTQGNKAVEELINAIELANSHQKCDVLIITRGGGSIEDLWAYNDENLAYSIYFSKIPTVSAIGHQNNYTICDYISDLRTPTPSAAAEMICPKTVDLEEKIKLQNRQINQTFKQKIHGQMQFLDYLLEKIEQKMERLLIRKKESNFKLKSFIGVFTNQFNQKTIIFNQQKHMIEKHNLILKIENYENQLKYKINRFNLDSLTEKISQKKKEINMINSQIPAKIRYFINHHKQFLNTTSATINSHIALSKGYIVMWANGKRVKSIDEIKPHQITQLQFIDGRAKAKIYGIEKKNKN